MESIENRERQALEQIGRIIAGLGPGSYIAEALREAFGGGAEFQSTAGGAANLADELRQVRLPDRTVQKWEADRREVLQRQLAEAEAQVAALKAELYDLTVKG
mgnify:CR=1 FL=1